MLKINAVLFIVLGVYSVLFNNTPLFSFIDWLMDPNFWKNEVLSEGTLKFKIFTWDLLGMFHIIWGINIFFIVKYGMEKNKEAWAWKCLLIQVIVWLVVIAYFTISIRKNTFLPVTFFLAVLFIIPLIMTKSLSINKV
jgi:hypothetical protein